MFKVIRYYVLRPFFIWLVIFAIFKSFFLIYHWNNISSENLSEIFSVFTNSIKLDISSISYLLLLPLLFSIFQFFINSNIVKKIAKYYHLIMIIVVSIINVSDIILYEYWSSKISLKAFLFLNTPSQIVATIGVFKFSMIAIFILFHFFIAKAVFEKYYFNKKIVFHKSNISFTFFFLLSATLLTIGIRGGLQEIPISQSSVYFSNNNTLNVASVNPFWNFMNVIVQNVNVDSKQYEKMDNNEAKNIVKRFYEIEKDTTIYLFNIKKPNIVYIALEGVNANVFKAINNKKSFAPNIENLFSEGYFFLNMYSSGFRSDQGMVSIFGGFPPTPLNSICAQPEKFANLSSMPKQMQNINYDFSFFHGGDASFGNFKSYLVYNGFKPIIDVSDFSKKEKTQSLGAPDEFLFKKFNEKMKNKKEPFFSMIFTLTTHEPFDMPFNKNVSDEAKKYLNTVLYTDSVIGKWFKEVKKMPWYDNTIFIISSDHSHFHPNNYEIDASERYHIPFLILGKPLKQEFIGKTNNKIVSMVDIPKTIIKQLNLNTDKFKWSKNMMNPYENEFAFYTYVNGSCLKTKKHNCGWEYNWNKNMGENCNSEKEKKENQAFMQVLFEDYLNY